MSRSEIETPPTSRPAPSATHGAIKFWLTLLLLATVAYGGYSAWRLYERRQAARSSEEESTSAEFLTGFEVRPFKLTDSSGEEFDSANLKGKVWIASFFFTNCHGACLMLNNSIAGLQKELEGMPVTFVSITVDPVNDTPKALRAYAEHYRADPQSWKFLTGELDDIERIAIEDFKVPFALLNHSDRMILVDQQGRVQGYFHGGDPTQMTRLKGKLKRLVEEKS